MKSDRPSGTAIMVAFARAAVTRDRQAPGHGLDPFARSLLPSRVRALLDALPVRAARAITLGLADHLELRSLAIDAVVNDALERGIPQLVILGAGLDARGLRLRSAAHAKVFEVDHPATQRYKRARVTGEPSAAAIRFVPVDFERDSLDQRLAEAGHDPSMPTVWIWEGTTMYLEPAATRATLEIVSQRSAPKSVLAVTYVTRDLVNSVGPVKAIATRVLARIGEPLRGATSRAEMREMVERFGFRVLDDTGVEDWFARFKPRRPGRIRMSERLLTAHKG